MAAKKKKTASDAAADKLAEHFETSGRSLTETVRLADVVQLVRQGKLAVPESE